MLYGIEGILNGKLFGSSSGGEATYNWVPFAADGSTCMGETVSLVSSENARPVMIDCVMSDTNQYRVTYDGVEYSASLIDEGDGYYTMSVDGLSALSINVYDGTAYIKATSGNAGDHSLKIEAWGVVESSGGITLPELTNPAGADQILEGYEAVDGSGNKLTGTHVCESGGGGNFEALISKSITTVSSNLGMVGGYAFYECTALTSADFPVATSIGYGAFYSCSKLTTANLPVATRIDSNTFYGCSALATVDFPVATSIGNGAFQKCSALATVDFPVVTSIGSNAFNGCSALTTVDFPVATSIGSYAFQSCKALKALILRNQTKATLSSKNAFTSASIESGTGYIYVPASLVDGYKSASNWSTYATQFRALEDYTVDGTITGELDESKI